MYERDANPQGWRLEVEQDRIDLYRSLSEQPRQLSPAEATMMVELVDAWRAAEHAKHVALMRALDELEGPRSTHEHSDPEVRPRLSG